MISQSDEMLGKRLLDHKGLLVGIITDENDDTVLVSNVEGVGSYRDAPTQALTQRIPKKVLRHRDDRNVEIVSEYLNSS